MTGGGSGLINLPEIREAKATMGQRIITAGLHLGVRGAGVSGLVRPHEITAAKEVKQLHNKVAQIHKLQLSDCNSLFSRWLTFKVSLLIEHMAVNLAQAQVHRFMKQPQLSFRHMFEQR